MTPRRRAPTVHSVLPDALTDLVAAALAPAAAAHVAHAGDDPLAAAEAAASDPGALALLGPLRSADVAHAVELTAPARLPLIAPVATWAGVTRDDEPGCDDPARHRGTVLRLVARDTVVAARIAADVARRGRRALVVAGDHDYGRQLDGQLRLAGLPRTRDPAQADLVVLAGLAGGAEVERAAALGPLPVMAFDGAQGGGLEARCELRVALPFAPDAAHDGGVGVAASAHRAALLVLVALRAGAADRGGMLRALRALGPFDRHGDPVDPPVWLWRARDGGDLAPDRPL